MRCQRAGAGWHSPDGPLGRDAPFGGVIVPGSARGTEIADLSSPRRAYADRAASSNRDRPGTRREPAGIPEIHQWGSRSSGTPRCVGTPTFGSMTNDLVDRSDHGLHETLAALGDEADRRTAELSDACRIPGDLYELAATSGLFRQLVATDLGGLGRTPLEWFRNGLALARHEASLGWVVTQGAAVLGQLASGGDPTWSTQVLADPRAAVAASIAGGGTLTPADDGYLVQARWDFVSGCDGATWLGGLAVLPLDGTAEGELPFELRWVLVPADRARIERTWDSIGLRGTGSHTLTIEQQRVPAAWTYRTGIASPHRTDPHAWTVGNGNWVIGTSVAATQLGIARRALDEVTALLPTKAPAPEFVPLAENAAARRALMAAEGRWAAAVHLAEVTLADLWEHAVAGRPLDAATRVSVAVANATANRMGVEVVRAAGDLAGTSLVPADHPLGRCLRDASALQGHISANAAIFDRAGAIHLGLAEPDALV